MGSWSESTGMTSEGAGVKFPKGAGGPNAAASLGNTKLESGSGQRWPSLTRSSSACRLRATWLEEPGWVGKAGTGWCTGLGASKRVIFAAVFSKTLTADLLVWATLPAGGWGAVPTFGTAICATIGRATLATCALVGGGALKAVGNGFAPAATSSEGNAGDTCMHMLPFKSIYIKSMCVHSWNLFWLHANVNLAFLPSAASSSSVAGMVVAVELDLCGCTGATGPFSRAAPLISESTCVQGWMGRSSKINQ